MVWSSHLFKNFPQFVVIHTVKGFNVVNKAEVDVFLELSCFFNDPADVGNLISGSSAFSKTSLNIWKFSVHVLLKPGFELASCSATFCPGGPPLSNSTSPAPGLSSFSFVLHREDYDSISSKSLRKGYPSIPWIHLDINHFGQRNYLKLLGLYF